jgi:hypothetical protein
MQVTRDVIVDLLPLYLAGEASGDTRSLVEHYLEQDPELARLARESSTRMPSADVPVTIMEEDEMRTIQRTRKLVKRRSTLLAFGILFTLLPLSVVWDANGVRWLWAGAPLAAAMIGALGLLSWVGYFTVRHRLRATGL